MILKSINPYTGEVIGEFEEYPDGKVEDILERSDEAFGRWKKSSFEQRASLMDKAGVILRKNIKEYALSITAGMGKPLAESKLEIEKCAWACDYYARNAAQFLRSEPVETDADISYVTYEPLGTILGIMPWNFPFWQVFRFAVPTLMAGNTILLKHASNIQICALKIEEVFTAAGFPPFVFANLVLGSARVDRVIKHDVVKAVSLTGSAVAGQRVAEAAGNGLKKSLLELGGSNAFVVLEDANIQKAVETGIKARFQNAGQSCISAKRFILHKKISERYISLFLEGTGKLKTGDPADLDTDIGPLANIEQVEILEEQVRKSVSMGARVITGGRRDKAFFQPAVVVDVTPGMPLFDEEVFGPVAPMTVVDNTEEAIALAGKTTFGLGVTLFTSDLDRARELVPKFHDGAVFINGLVKSDPRMPFGGTRHSGYGRELSVHGIREFVNVKTIWVKKV